jgi:hypothetical protein
VVEVIETYQFEIDGLCVRVSLNILPLGSYDVLLCMDWITSHKEKLICYEKNLECEDEEGDVRVLEGILKLVSVKKILTLQLNNFIWKGFHLYAIQVINSSRGKEMKVEYHPVLW